METVLLGTGFPIPDPDRAGPSTLVKAGGLNLVFDAGRALLMRLAGAGVMPPQVSVVFLTHLHSDHVADFNELVTMHWAMPPEQRKLRVVGPRGTKEFCDRTLTMLERDIGWRIEHHADLTWEPDLEVTEVRDGVAFEGDGVRVLAEPTLHLPVKDTVAYRVETEAGSVVIGGDTVPCDGLDRICDGADLYVQTVLRRPLIEAIPSPRLVEILNYHSSTVDAAQTAARAGVKKLVFTHMMPTPARGTEQEWLNDAKEHFDGDVVLPKDLDVVAL